MKGIVKVSVSNIGGSEVNSVNLRDVFEFINENKETKFTDWARDRLVDWEISKDYTTVRKFTKRENSNLGTHTEEFIVTLDTAKHICMIERNDKGKQLRQYFIDCEKALTQPKPASTFDLMRMQIDQLESLSKRTQLLEQNINAIDERQGNDRFSSEQIQQLERLFKEVTKATGDVKISGKIKRDLKQRFLDCSIASCTYKDISRKHFDKACQIIETYMP
jgi:phage anti-repressor protein